MKQQISMDLLKQVDETTEERIAEEFPINWGKEALFERIYQRYLEQPQAAASAAPIRQSRIHLYRRAGIAACLLLMTGLSLGIWSRQQQVESRPHEDQIRPTQTENTRSQTPRETQDPLCTTVPAAIPAVTETQAAAPAQTEPTVQETAVTVQMTEQPRVTDAPAQQMTVPDASELPAVTATETQAATAPETQPQTEPATEPAEEKLTGFRVEQHPGWRRVVCTDPFPAPTGELTLYTVDSESFVLDAEVLNTDEPVRTYEIRRPDTDKVFIVTQQEYAEFALTVEEGALIDISLNRARGFFLLQDEICSLYWFIDGEGFFVSGDAGDLRDLMAIVRSFTPANE